MVDEPLVRFDISLWIKEAKMGNRQAKHAMEEIFAAILWEGGGNREHLTESQRQTNRKASNKDAQARYRGSVKEEMTRLESAAIRARKEEKPCRELSKALMSSIGSTREAARRVQEKLTAGKL